MSRRAFVFLLLTDLTASVLVLGTHHLQLLDEVPYKGFVNANLVGLSALAAWMALRAARRDRRLTTRLTAGVLGLLCLGEVLCLTQDWLLADMNWPLDAYDLVWLFARGLLLVALLWMRGESRPTTGRALAVWAAVVGIVLAGVWWTVLPLTNAAADDVGPFALPMVLADLSAFVLAAVAFQRGGLAPRSGSLAVIGVGILLATDLLLYRDVAGVSAPFVFGEMGYFAGYLTAAGVGLRQGEG